MKTLLFLPFLLLAVLASAAELDFGDQKSATLTTKAWEALGAGKHADAVTFAKKCITMYEKEAIKMQAGLKDYVEDDSNGAVEAKWALNDVGTCYFIMGSAQEKLGKKKAALASYEAVGKKLKFAQCWDPQGWFWKPAAASAERIEALNEADAKKEE